MTCLSSSSNATEKYGTSNYRTFLEYIRLGYRLIKPRKKVRFNKILSCNWSYCGKYSDQLFNILYNLNFQEASCWRSCVGHRSRTGNRTPNCISIGEIEGDRNLCWHQWRNKQWDGKAHPRYRWCCIWVGCYENHFLTLFLSYAKTVYMKMKLSFS